MKRIGLIPMAILLLAFQSFSQIIHIPADQTTIQAGIDAAVAGDTVLVAEGTWYENINFKGKSITLASLFIMDGDTAHISRTIIDGSQASNPDSASVVYMCSGEDTTSVLMGFTITGGKGTDYIRKMRDGTSRNEVGGGGVFIITSGGKIIHNTIQGNNVEKPFPRNLHCGGGILAFVYNNHSVVIRENIISNNVVTGNNAAGGGIHAICGRILCEYNEITNNSINAEVWTYGGGVSGFFYDEEGVIKEVIIRNNLISGNSAKTTINGGGGGGGYYQHGGFGKELTQVYNNVICNNRSTFLGAGALFWDYLQGSVFNNTIVNNTIENTSWPLGRNVVVVNNWPLSFYNNIIWSFGNSTIPEFGLVDTDATNLKIFNNIIKQPFLPDGMAMAFDNRHDEPVFESGSYALAENSPGIGWGIDSFQINDTMYYAPSFDFYGNPRPHPIDGFIDLGAIESPFPRQVDNANLTHIGLWDRKLWPDFHKDSLHYFLPVPDTTIVTPQLDVVAEDWLAEIDINNADDIGSSDLADRTTTITVTAYNGTTQKTYTVLFRYASTDKSLSNLSISKGALVPEFHTDSLIYTVCLPKDEKIAPPVNYETTDSNATVFVKYAPNIQLPDPWNQYREYRTTVITVTAEDGIHKAVYEIEHLIDKTIPEIVYASDTFNLGENIEITSTEDGWIYLVPVNTLKNLDSIMFYMIDSTSVKAGVPASVTAPDCKAYWLYAIDKCLNISTTATPIICVGISKTTTVYTHLYPNPIEHILYIETAQTISSVELFNVIGVKVMDKSKPEGRIDMSQLEQGMYFIRIRTDRDGVYTGKVVKR